MSEVEESRSVAALDFAKKQLVKKYRYDLADWHKLEPEKRPK